MALVLKAFQGLPPSKYLGLNLTPLGNLAFDKEILVVGVREFPGLYHPLVFADGEEAPPESADGPPEERWPGVGRLAALASARRKVEAGRRG